MEWYTLKKKKKRKSKRHPKLFPYWSGCGLSDDDEYSTLNFFFKKIKNLTLNSFFVG